MKDIRSCENVMYNITEYTINDENINIFKQLNYDEKYINGSASDFELFDAWECAAFLCAGHRALKTYVEGLSKFGMRSADFSQYSRELSIARWRTALFYQNTEVFERTPPFSEGADISEKYILKRLGIEENPRYISFLDINKLVLDFTMDCHCLFDVVERIYNVPEAQGNSCISMIISLLDGDFERPDPYASNCLFLKNKSGDFLNNTEKNIILSQVLIELLIRYKNEKDLTVLIKKAGDITPVMSFAAYLDFRRLFEGEIWVEISDASDLKAMLEANTYRNIHIRPFIDLTDKIFSVSEYLELFRVYPVGAFVIKNGRNNGELLSVIEAIAQNKSHSEFLLRRICI